jgi:predicted nucleic acid-binding protein
MNGRSVFVDTSGFIALLDADDSFHGKAVTAWTSYGEGYVTLFTSDYVRLESWALIQRRLGAEAALDFADLILPACTVLTVGEEGFLVSINEWRLARRRRLSLVDVTSFHLMRHHEIREVFGYDGHFAEEGFITPA